MKKITVILCAVALGCLLLFSMCKKDTNTAGNSALAVRLKDAPHNWDRCMVELRGIRIHTSMGGWITIPINDTTIDILKLQDTSLLIGNININAGVITQVDLMLGMRDSVTIGGITFVVNPMPGNGDDIFLTVNDTLLPGGSFTLLLDLNAGQFVHDDGDGQHFHWGDGCLSGAFRRDWGEGHDH